MSLNWLEKLMPSEYHKVERETDVRKEVYFARESKESLILAMACKISRRDFLPEIRSFGGVDWLRSLEKHDSCIVDFRDVVVNGVLCRYYITKDQTKEKVCYFLNLYVCKGRKIVRLFVSGVERGDSYQRRSIHEDEYRKIVADVFGTSSENTGYDCIYRMPREGLCYALGEDPFYDNLYPEHPLTQLRLLVKSVVRKVGKVETKVVA
ncbi:hypothetical protein [uncultured Fibrobacter sp.]|uniref:hypothetical protein n=1 Tax=uncultured Fibrobacter sp. TaxID=261512 RepID=UPI00260DD326|nr:hypothetical protein [uncultured Fibrobacter sp.]